MAMIKIYSLDGTEIEKKEVPSGLFEAKKISTHLLHEVIRAEEANARQGTASTKTRSEVSGGGKKPWRQKGTGRARHGSIRSPIWRKGGTVFGPHPRDYSVKLNKKEKRIALASALSIRFSEERVIGINVNGLEEPKTKKFVQFLRNFSGVKRPLFVHLPKEDTVVKSIRNIDNVSHKTINNLSTRAIMLSDFIIFTSAAVDRLESEKGIEV